MNILAGKSVLVTGGSGSFGHAFVKRLLAMQPSPARVCVLSRDEYKQAVMRSTFNDDHRLRWFLGDVRDLERLKMAFHGIDIVVHAAAMKQVPACEYNVLECFATNFTGSANVMLAAIYCKVPRVIALSTDKSVAPTTSYGASKLAMERVIIGGNAMGPGTTRLSCTRYGNVQDSRLSVLPVWRDQIARGEPISITNASATRFHMEQREAVDLVLLAASKMRGGEIYVPKLAAYRLGYLAEAFAPGHPQKIIGLRGTEKLHEALLSLDEIRYTTDQGGHFEVLPPSDARGNLPEGFVYRSDTVPMLSVEELRNMVEIAP